MGVHLLSQLLPTDGEWKRWVQCGMSTSKDEAILSDWEPWATTSHCVMEINQHSGRFAVLFSLVL